MFEIFKYLGDGGDASLCSFDGALVGNVPSVVVLNPSVVGATTLVVHVLKGVADKDAYVVLLLACEFESHKPSGHCLMGRLRQ